MSDRTAQGFRRAAAHQRKALPSLRRNANFATARKGKADANAVLNSTTQRTVANYVPYATTIFDYTRRAMPWQQPKSLTIDEAYALTAYILALNKIIGENEVMNADTLPKVKMPNRDGFVSKYPEKH